MGFGSEGQQWSWSNSRFILREEHIGIRWLDEESRMTPKFFSWVPGRMKRSFTVIGRPRCKSGGKEVKSSVLDMLYLRCKPTVKWAIKCTSLAFREKSRLEIPPWGMERQIPKIEPWSSSIWRSGSWGTSKRGKKGWSSRQDNPKSNVLKSWEKGIPWWVSG